MSFLMKEQSELLFTEFRQFFTLSSYRTLDSSTLAKESDAVVRGSLQPSCSGKTSIFICSVGPTLGETA